MDFINIAGIVKESIVDGPRIRYTIFVQGCPHNCLGCHNKQTHSFESGTKISIDEILNQIKSLTYINDVTFSGGEPFCQAKALSVLAKKLKIYNFHIVVYTGYTFEELFESTDFYIIDLLNNIDILIDGKFDINQKNLDLKFRGSKNQRILDVKKSIMEAFPVWIEEYK